MNIKVYEDQTGLMVFPENRPQKDENIVKLFHNKVDLFVKKTGDNLEISCYMLAHKGLARDLGYYIIYTNFYSDAVFANFKKDIDKILRDLKIQVSSNNQENIIFDNIEKFDPKTGIKLDYGYEHNIDVVKNTLREGKRLEYTAGNVNEISIFCRDVLKKINNVEICITSGDNKLGNINISRKKNEKFFYPSESTKQILNEYKKKESEGLGKDKIAEGFSGPIKDGVNIFKNIGRDPTDSIINEMNKVVDINKIYDNLSSRIGKKDKDETTNEGLGVISKIFIGFTILVIGIVIGMIIYPYVEGKFIKGIENPATITANPTMTPIPTIMTPIPTSTTPIPTIMTPVPNSTSIPTNGSANSTNLTILTFYPKDKVINGFINNESTFSITTNQITDITWRLNGDKVQYNPGANTSNYTTTASVTGMLIINVTADTVNGSVSREWTWNIKKGS